MRLQENILFWRSDTFFQVEVRCWEDVLLVWATANYQLATIIGTIIKLVSFINIL